jgi:endonuclease YncB( thermonuclease family)
VGDRRAVGDDEPGQSPSGSGDPDVDAADGASVTKGKKGRSNRDRDGRPPRVTRVIDGDTLELGNGQSVRLVGIDAAEAGESASRPRATR